MIRGPERSRDVAELRCLVHGLYSSPEPFRQGLYLDVDTVLPLTLSAVQGKVRTVPSILGGRARLLQIRPRPLGGGMRVLVYVGISHYQMPDTPAQLSAPSGYCRSIGQRRTAAISLNRTFSVRSRKTTSGRKYAFRGVDSRRSAPVTENDRYVVLNRRLRLMG